MDYRQLIESYKYKCKHCNGVIIIMRGSSGRIYCRDCHTRISADDPLLASILVPV